MSEILKVKAEDKEGTLIAEFDLELPTTFEELSTIPGDAKALTMVRNQMKIEARAKYKGHGSTSALPKKDQTVIKEALKDGVLSLEDLMAFIKSRKAQ